MRSPKGRHGYFLLDEASLYAYAFALWWRRVICHDTWRQIASFVTHGWEDNQLLGMELCVWAQAKLPWPFSKGWN